MTRSGDPAADADSANQRLRHELALLDKRITELEKERTAETARQKKGQREAESKTEQAETRIKALDAVLARGLSGRPLTFEDLKEDENRPAPELVLPRDPGPLRVIPGVAGWHERREQRAQEQHERAHADHVQRIREAARLNAHVDDRRSGFAAGDPAAVEWFIAKILSCSDYPKSFPSQHRVAFQPERGAVVVELELPPLQVVPAVDGYQYDQQLGKSRPIRRTDGEIRQQYKRLIASVALRTIHEIFAAAEPYRGVVREVAINGQCTGREEAVGESRTVLILSVRVSRNAFAGQELADVQPAECLTSALGGRLSPYPFGLVPLEHEQPHP